MKNILLKIQNSNFFKFSQRIITLDNDKKFVVSSLAYYLIISFIPMITLTSYFLKIFHLDNDFSNLIPPEITNQTSYNIILIFSAFISIYIASKGINNYYNFINEKFMLKQLPYPFLTNKLYSSLLTLFVCFLLALINSLNYYLTNLNLFIFNFLKWNLNILFLFILILLLNYFLLRRKISIKYLITGSLITSILLSFTTFIIQLYLSVFEQKEKYYGNFTNLIVILLFAYLISYFICLGNQINYMIYERK